MAQKPGAEKARKKVEYASEKVEYASAKREKARAKGETGPAETVVEKATARDMSKSDWLTVRYLASVELVPTKVLARRFGIHPTTIRTRIADENWRDPRRIAELPTLEELIVMRNRKVILDALNSMTGKLDAVMRSGNEDEVKLAAKRADLVGKTVRSTQSAARATDVTAATERQSKAMKAPAREPEKDRAAIKAELDKLAQTAPSNR